MKIRDEFNDIRIENVNMSVRAFNALKRAKIHTLADLAQGYSSGVIDDLRNIGVKTVSEIVEVLIKYGIITREKHNVEDGIQPEYIEKEQKLDYIFECDILDRPVTDMKLSQRILYAFEIVGINTVRDALLLSTLDIFHLKNLGSISFAQINKEVEKLYELKGEYFLDEKADVNGNELLTKKMDIDLIRKLEAHYGFKTAWLMGWFGLSRQAVYNRLRKDKNPGNWQSYSLAQVEEIVISDMLSKHEYRRESEDKSYVILNNMKDNCIIIINSQEVVKAFFLENLPISVQDQIIEKDMHRLSEDEYGYALEGKRVFILKEEYFIPDHKHEFGVLASRRGMNIDEYSQFLFGLPYTSNKQITDDKIIEFLEEHIENGRVIISSDSMNQWIRSYASRYGYSLADFVKFYGFNYINESMDSLEAIYDNHRKSLEECIVDDDNTVYLTTGSVIYTKLCLYANNNGMKLDEYIKLLGFKRTFYRPVENDDEEKDMEVYEVDGTSIEKIYAKYPLLGSCILKQEDLEKLYKKTKLYIDKKLFDSAVTLSIQAELQITMAVINYAKYWDNECDGRFWQYISLKFGYRDKGDQIRGLLLSCIKNAFFHTRRWFYEDTKGSQYKSTVLIHAMSTKRTWMNVCDLLFDFYTTNLNWNYVGNDPLIERMVEALRKKVSNSEEDDANILISSKAYFLQEGPKKIISSRPKYATLLFSRMIRRIDQLINHMESDAKTYEELLCDEWMAEKIRRISETKRNRKNVIDREVVLDYSKVRPVYRLENNNDAVLVLPDVRLKQTEFRRLELRIYDSEELLSSKSLSYYGNELGRTMSGFSVSLKRDFSCRSNTKAFNLRLQIMCDNGLLYDSEATLFRDYVLFDGRDEIRTNLNLRKGCYIVIPLSTELTYSNVEKMDVEENREYRLCYLSLGEDYILMLDGNVIALDDKAISKTELKVITQRNGREASYIKNNNRYQLIEKSTVIHIAISSCDVINKYYITVNGISLNLGEAACEEKEENRIYHIQLGDFNTSELCLQIINLVDSKLIRRDFYRIVKNIDYSFNKKYYFNDDDFNNCFLHINQLDELVGYEQGFSKEDRTVQVAYEGGYFEIIIPIVKVIDSRNREWLGCENVWIKDITQDLFMQVIAPEDLKVNLVLNTEPLGMDGELYGVGNALAGRDFSLTKKVPLYLIIDEKQYLLATIFTQESFLEKPKFWLEDGTLFWDRGHGFFGDRSIQMTIRIIDDNNCSFEYRIDIANDNIIDNIELNPGEYRFYIIKKSENVFIQNERILEEGNFVIGDINTLRFLNKRIVINKLTFEKEKQSGSLVEGYTYESLSIKTVYIDKIQFKQVEYVGSEDMNCPVYSGILYYFLNGERHEYSFEDGISSKGFRVEKINPITIIVLSESTLIINNFDGDGLYYYCYYDRDLGQKVNLLTDRVPNSSTEKYYNLTDLYLYTKERV